MQIPHKKLKNGFQIPSLGVGTWGMGGLRERNQENNDKQDIKALRYAISKGLRAIDTAEMYAAGYSEILVGAAIRPYKREDLFISSKVKGNTYTLQGIKNACEKSLNRMGIEYIDLYYLHWKDKKTPLKIVMQAMSELVEEGKIKYIGVSNLGIDSLKEAQKYSRYPIVANQVHYNIMYREAEDFGLLEYCQHNDIILVAWAPLESGELLKDNSDIFIEMCQKYQQEKSSIALRWLLEQENVVTLFKSSQLEHIDICLTALDWKMSKEDVESLRQNYHHKINTSSITSLK